MWPFTCLSMCDLDKEKLRWVVIKVIEKIYELKMNKVMSLLKVTAANSKR